MVEDNLYHYRNNPTGITNDISVEKVVGNVKDNIYLNNLRRMVAQERYGYVDNNSLINRTLSLVSSKIIHILASSKNVSKDLIYIQNGLSTDLRAFLGSFSVPDLNSKGLNRKVSINIINGDFLKNMKYRPVCRLVKVLGIIK